MRNFAILTLAALAFTFVGLLASDERSEPNGVDTAASPRGSGGPETGSQAPAAGLAVSDCRAGVALYRSVFTDAVKDRVPQKRFVALGPEVNEVVFFTELIGARGRPITHRWLHDDVEVASFSFDVASERSESWSVKPVEGIAPGVLRVEVLDGNCLIGQESVPVVPTSEIDPATGRTGCARSKRSRHSLRDRRENPRKS